MKKLITFLALILTISCSDDKAITEPEPENKYPEVGGFYRVSENGMIIGVIGDTNRVGELCDTEENSLPIPYPSLVTDHFTIQFILDFNSVGLSNVEFRFETAKPTEYLKEKLILEFGDNFKEHTEYKDYFIYDNSYTTERQHSVVLNTSDFHPGLYLINIFVDSTKTYCIPFLKLNNVELDGLDFNQLDIGEKVNPFIPDDVLIQTVS